MSAHIGISKKDFVLALLTAPEKYITDVTIRRIDYSGKNYVVSRRV